MVSVSDAGTARMSRPPVMIWARPSATDRVPRVTISGGIFALATSHPLQQPPEDAADNSAEDADEGDVPALTAHGLHRLGGDHGGEDQHRPDRQVDPEVMMTKVIPTASTAQMETFWVMLEKLAGRGISSAAMPKMATMTSRTPRIHTDCMA